MRYLKHHSHHPHAGVGRGPHHHHCHRSGEDQMDNSQLTRGRKFSAKDLQLMFLALLAEKPAHGYELIKEIEQRSSAYYTPSPGVVYPALTYLEETGLVEVEPSGNRKLYRVSAQGLSALEQQQEAAKLLLAGLVFMGKKMEVMRQAMSGQPHETANSGWIPEYVSAQRTLKHILIGKAEADEAEQRRIAAILCKAINEIQPKEPQDA